MVKEIDGQGGFYRDVWQNSGIDREEYSKIVLYPHSPDIEKEVLNKLSAMPNLDNSSFLLIDVVDAKRREAKVLLVPKECPRLIPNRYIETNGLPPGNQTFLVETFRDGDSRARYTVVVLADDPEAAARIAKRRVATKVPYPSKNIEAQAELVSPEEWVDAARQLIDDGIRLPDFMLRFAGLGEYQRQVEERARKSSEIPLAI